MRTDSNELREHLRGTKWQWHGVDDEIVTFNENGYVDQEYIGHPNWDNWTRRGLLTRWDVIDRRTVLLVIERGRDTDRYAILAFNDDVSMYDGFNFHDGERLAASRRLP